jgi:hypothetical protein
MSEKNTLWSFGDSFSTPYGDKPYKVCDEYINYKGYEPKMFSNIIAETLGMNCIIKAKGGLDNYSIMENVCNISDKVIDGDLIIIGWSHINRFRIVKKNGEWLPILPFLRLTKFEEFNMDMLDIFAMNRLDFEDKYTNEVNSWIKLIDLAYKNCTVIHWSAHQKTKINATIIKNITTISKETKNIIEDTHHSETGQKELANIFLNKILKKEINLL